MINMSSGSLVKYNTPILVNLGANKKGKGGEKKKGVVHEKEAVQNPDRPNNQRSSGL